MFNLHKRRLRRYGISLYLKMAICKSQWFCSPLKLKAGQDHQAEIKTISLIVRRNLMFVRRCQH